jgi:3,4-dihydroxy 2-butanone 4-phosphate synthase/GTP cyclohydrolase II
MNPPNLFCTVPEALGELQGRRVLIVVDGENENSEASLVAATDGASLDTLRFMQSNAGGLMCSAHSPYGFQSIKMPKALLEGFSIGASFGNEQSKDTCSRELKTGASKVKPCGSPSGMRHPLVPLCSRKNGVLSRPGHAEAIVDLARLAALSPSGFLCKILRHGDRPLCCLSSLAKFGHAHGLRMLSVTELVKHRMASETHVRPAAVIHLRTRYGGFRFINFTSDVLECCGALVKGGDEIFELSAPLVRIEPVSSIGDACTSLLTYLNDSFDAALNLMYHKGNGIVVCVPTPQLANDEDRFLSASLPFFQDDPFLTLGDSAHHRLMSAGICAQILHHLHADQICVISDKPQRLADLNVFGIKFVETLSPSRKTKLGQCKRQTETVIS